MMDKQTSRPTRPLFTTFPEKYVVHAFLELLLKWKARLVFVSRNIRLDKFASDLFLFVRAILFISKFQLIYFPFWRDWTNLVELTLFRFPSISTCTSSITLKSWPKTIDISHKNWISLLKCFGSKLDHPGFQFPESRPF